MADAELNHIGIVESAIGGIHCIWNTVFVVSADDQHGERIEPRLFPYILRM